MARSFSGGATPTDYINVGTGSVLRFTNTFTISSWVYVNSMTSNMKWFIQGSGGVSGWGVGYLLASNSWGFTKCGVADIGSGVTPSVNIWTHVLWTVSASANPILYINGALANNTGNTSGITPSSLTAYIGTDFGAAVVAFGWTGLIAETSLWGTILSAGEIAALGAGAKTRSVRPASQVGYWPLYGLASPEPDLSGNKNNGTLTGTAYTNHPPIDLSTWTRPSIGTTVTAASVKPWWQYATQQVIGGPG